MPYKTRRQKISAVKRRYSLANTLNSGAYVYDSEKKAVQKTQGEIEGAGDLRDLKRDLQKIIIISSIIIFTQTCIRLTLF